MARKPDADDADRRCAPRVQSQPEQDQHDGNEGASGDVVVEHRRGRCQLDRSLARRARPAAGPGRAGRRGRWRAASGLTTTGLGCARRSAGRGCRRARGRRRWRPPGGRAWRRRPGEPSAGRPRAASRPAVEMRRARSSRRTGLSRIVVGEALGPADVTKAVRLSHQPASVTAPIDEADHDETVATVRRTHGVSRADAIRSMHRVAESPPADRSRRMLGRGAVRRCPRCGGRGAWFTGWFRRVDRCRTCGYRYEREEGFMVGAIAINTILTFGAILIVLVVGMIVTLPRHRRRPDHRRCLVVAVAACRSRSSRSRTRSGPRWSSRCVRWRPPRRPTRRRSWRLAWLTGLRRRLGVDPGAPPAGEGT